MENEKSVNEVVFTAETQKYDSVKAPEKEDNFLNVLKLFSPGTSLRTAVDDMVRAKMGALIVVECEGIAGGFEGGFRVNCKFSAQRLVELAKMDGAIILSNDMKKIIYANTLLVPSVGIKTKETGTRHKAAERISKQFGAVVIAVSERKNKTTIYWGNEKYVLENSSEILRRATETLQILEKQKESFNDLLLHLNVLEITNLSNTRDVCEILQRAEMMKKISEIVKRCLVELGKEGIIVSMRLKELTRDFNKERDLILEDYFTGDSLRIKNILESMNFDFLLETSNISRMIFEDLHDNPVSPKGFRILSKTGLLEKDINLLLNNFGNLDKIFELGMEDLGSVFKNEGFVGALISDLRNLREKILAGKRV
jgi:diadenylate cyclase